MQYVGHRDSAQRRGAEWQREAVEHNVHPRAGEDLRSNRAGDDFGEEATA